LTNFLKGVTQYFVLNFSDCVCTDAKTIELILNPSSFLTYRQVSSLTILHELLKKLDVLGLYLIKPNFFVFFLSFYKIN